MGFQPFRESPAFLWGREGEEQVGRFLKSRGFFLLPACDYSGPIGERAPKIQGAASAIVVPDFGMARAGRWGWAEVKAKWDATFTRATGLWEHGIGQRLYRHYRAFQDTTGAPVWLFILEARYQRLRFQTLDQLEPWIRFYDGDVMDPGGMVFWPRHAFYCVVLDELPGLFDSGIPLAFEKGDL